MIEPIGPCLESSCRSIPANSLRYTASFETEEIVDLRNKAMKLFENGEKEIAKLQHAVLSSGQGGGGGELARCGMTPSLPVPPVCPHWRACMAVIDALRCAPDVAGRPWDGSPNTCVAMNFLHPIGSYYPPNNKVPFVLCVYDFTYNTVVLTTDFDRSRSLTTFGYFIR